MKSYACGLEVFLALVHDFVLRRNIRVIFALPNPASSRTPFVSSLFGSHHIGLVDHIARRHNQVIQHAKEMSEKSGNGKGKEREWGAPSTLPILMDVGSGERFGLVYSPHIASFGGKLQIKQEDENEDSLEFSTLHESLNEEEMLRGMNIDPALLLVPENLSESSKAQKEPPQKTTPPSSDKLDAPSSTRTLEQKHEVIVSPLIL